MPQQRNKKLVSQTAKSSPSSVASTTQTVQEPNVVNQDEDGATHTTTTAATTTSTEENNAGALASQIVVPKPKRARKKDLALNLQAPSSHPRPSRSVFVFGCGDLGQFGLGVDKLIEIQRPRPHSWFDKASEGGILGEVGAGLEKVCAGGLHTLAIDENGHIWSFGVNDNGALGRQTSKVVDPANPERILRSDELESNPTLLQTLVDENFRAVHVAAGDSISIAIGDTGEIRAWGSFRSSDGPLGFTGLSATEQNQIYPIPLREFTKLKFVDAVCGKDHVVALTQEGGVRCFR